MKRLLLILIVLGGIGTAAGYWVSSCSNGSESGFTYESVRYDTMTDIVNAGGIVKPHEIAVVYSKVPGTVQEVFGHVGQKVEKDQPLFRVGSEMTKVNLQKAQAAVDKTKGLEESAKKRVEKVKEMREKGYGSLKEELEAEAQLSGATYGVKEAQSALEQANLAMEWTTVKAPISGTIIEKNLYLGQPVGPYAFGGGGTGSAAQQGPSPISSSIPSVGTSEPKVPFMIAADLGDMEVYAQIPQGDIGRVKVGMHTSFTVDAYPNEKPFEGEIAEIQLMPINVLGATFYPAVVKVANRRETADPNSPNASAKNQSDWILRPGMTVNVEIVREKHKNVWMMPSGALTFQLDEHYMTPDAKQEMARIQSEYKNSNDWRVVWTTNNKKPWPIAARIGGKNSEGRPGISNDSYTEVLEWKPAFKPENPDSYPKLIIAAPQPKQSIFDRGTIKIS
jgi:HlyD family secretion protein